MVLTKDFLGGEPYAIKKGSSRTLNFAYSANKEDSCKGAVE